MAEDKRNTESKSKHKEYSGRVLVDFKIDGVSYRRKDGKQVYKTTDEHRFEKLIKNNNIKKI